MEEIDKKMAIALAKHLLKSQIDNRHTEYPPGVAKYGEKVVSLIHDQDSSIERGEIFTVNSFHLDSYNFKECPAEYNPYLGEDAARWFSEKYFMPVGPQSESIIRSANNLEEAFKQRMDVLRRDISEHVVSVHINKKAHKEDFLAYLEELISWLHQYDNEFKEYLSKSVLENCGQFELKSDGFVLEEALQQCHFFKNSMEKRHNEIINQLYPATYKTRLEELKYKSTQYFKVQNFAKEYPTFIDTEVEKIFVKLNFSREIGNVFALQLKSATNQVAK